MHKNPVSGKWKLAEDYLNKNENRQETQRGQLNKN